MSVSSEVARLRSAKSDLVSAIEEKGVAVPAGATLDELPALVRQIPVMTAEEAFLAAHPVGCVYREVSGVSPASEYGGTWEPVPSLGAFAWERTA